MMDLSIIIITMNRAAQLCEAIQSCLKCNLPEGTEFVIIDNASSDNTEDTVHQLMNETNHKIIYKKLPENLGVGGGRNFALKYVTGNYIYVLDDDAVIDDVDKDFFLKAIAILEKNPNYATLTTQIYDTAWKDNRLKHTDLKVADNIYECFMPCGGSHFFRRSDFVDPVYYPNKYGYEEIAVAMQAYKNGRINVFCSDLRIIHKPKINKWVVKDNKQHFINDFASQYAIKKVLYPKCVLPLLWTAYKARYFRYLHGSQLSAQGTEIINGLVNIGSGFNRIDISTFIHLVRKFGFSIL